MVQEGPISVLVKDSHFDRISYGVILYIHRASDPWHLINKDIRCGSSLVPHLAPPVSVPADRSASSQCNRIFFFIIGYVRILDSYIHTPQRAQLCEVFGSYVRFFAVEFRNYTENHLKILKILHSSKHNKKHWFSSLPPYGRFPPPSFSITLRWGEGIG